MLYALLLFSIVIAMVGHELGHAYAMTKCGVTVKEIGIGLPIGPGISFTLTRKHDPEHPLTISLYLLLAGAFVRPYDEKSIERLPAADAAFIFGAGVMMNIFMLTVAMIGQTFATGLMISYHLGGYTFPLPYVLPTLIAIVCWSMVSPRTLALYAFPVLGLVSTWFLVDVLSGLSSQRFIDSAGGIVAAGQIAERFADSGSHANFFFMLLSFGLAQFNLMPIYPLDGGHIAKLHLKRYMPKILPLFDRTGTLFFIVVIIFTVGGDLRRIFLMFN